MLSSLIFGPFSLGFSFSSFLYGSRVFLLFGSFSFYFLSLFACVGIWRITFAKESSWGLNDQVRKKHLAREGLERPWRGLGEVSKVFPAGRGRGSVEPRARA